MFSRLNIQLVAAFALALAAIGHAHAQVTRCKGPNGQTIYSDRPCEDGSKGQSVNVDANTIDGEYDRRDADKNRMNAAREARAREVDRMINNPPQECKFRHFAIGDSKGKELARLAKHECIENMFRERDGQPTSDRHYRTWNDHHNRTSNARQAIARDAIIQNQIQNQNMQQRHALPPSYKCRPDGFGAVNCSAQ
ncbi:DUF4124 domain-containing protein [Delftia deserti]|uniref:DUF4124 domain-containing protein n=1 Tax=Delftia deserti TaxID=1651218 RepID=A0ABW5EXH9_9BURK